MKENVMKRKSFEYPEQIDNLNKYLCDGVKNVIFLKRLLRGKTSLTINH